MLMKMISRIVLTASVAACALIGSSKPASACPPLVHQYGMHGVLLPQGGFLVEQVFPYTEAAFDGLQPGDVIVQCNSVQVFAIVHIHGPFSIAVNGPAVAVMTVVRQGQVFIVEAF
jgi:hypothetical protein